MTCVVPLYFKSGDSDKTAEQKTERRSELEKEGKDKNTIIIRHFKLFDILVPRQVMIT